MAGQDSQLEVELVSQDLEFLHLKVHADRRLVVPFKHILAISVAKNGTGKATQVKNANHRLCKQSSNNLSGKSECYSVGNMAGRKSIANVCIAKGSMHANTFIDSQQT